MLKFSVLLNLVLLGALCCVLVKFRKTEIVPLPVASKTNLSSPANGNPNSQAQTATSTTAFRWNQLDSGNDYRLFVAHLRAIGCPENTIRDIVRGNVGRAFAWERSRLKLDGYENSSWSADKEKELVGSLLGQPYGVLAGSPENSEYPVALNGAANTTAMAQDSVSSTSQAGKVEPAVIRTQNGQSAASQRSSQNEDWIATARQLSSMSQAQQSANGINNQNQYANNSVNPNVQSASPGSNLNDSPGAQLSQPASSASSDPYALSSQDIMALDQQKYNEWFKSQAAAQAGSGNLTINPFAFSSQ